MMSRFSRLDALRFGRKKVLAIGIVFSLGIALSMFNTARAAVAHVATTTGDNAGGSTSLVINHPATSSVGSVMIAAVGVRGGSGVTVTATGWTQISTSNTTTATTMKSTVYYRVIAAGDPSSFTFTFSTTQKASGVISAYSGVDASDPVNAQNLTANASSTSLSAPTVTTTVPDTMIIAAYSTANGTTLTAGSSMTLRGQDASTGGNATTRTTTGLQDITQAAAAATGAKTMTAGAAALNVGHLIALRPDPVVSQAKFRFFANTDSTTASTPLAAIDTAAAAAKQTPFRLRMNLGLAAGGSNLTAVAGRTYKLQYALRGGDNTCDTSFTNETYADVSASTPVQFFNNATPADGAIYVSSANDPTRGLTNIMQYYEEVAPMGMRTAVSANQDGHWDLSLTTSSSVTEGAYYCLRVVNGNGSVLSGSYLVVPQIYVQPPTITQSNYRWYPNADNIAPAAPTVAQNTPTTVAPGTPFRLRQRLAVDSAQLALSAGSYKLQYAEKSGTCSTSFGGSPSFVNNTGGPTVSQSKFPTAAQNVGSGPAPWQNPQNVFVSDDTYSNAVANNIGPVDTDTLRTSNYGFSIPANATITGIVLAGYAGIIGGGDDKYTYLKKNGSFSANRASGIIWGDTMIWGSTTDLWGLTWTPADINASSFGADIVASVYFDSAVGLDDLSIIVHYNNPNSLISFNDNPTATQGATISSSNDPTGRTTAYQTYNETDPYSNSVAAVASGSDGLWDFSLTSDSSALGKTYCFRTVKADGTPLDTYAVYPEITFGSTGPTLDQQVRGGASVINGTKSPLTF